MTLRSVDCADLPPLAATFNHTRGNKMASKKIKDLAVKTGSYQDRDGATKNRYENIGALFKSDDGSVYLVIKRTFNPAGVEVEPGRDSIIVSAFDLKPADGQTAAPAARQQAPQRQPAAPVADDSDIPF